MMADPLPKTSALRAVLFDLDNTLYDRDQTFEQCAHGFVEKHLAILEQDRRAEVLEQILTQGIKGYGARQTVFAEVLRRFPDMPDDADALDALFYRQWLTHMRLDAGTLRLLKALDMAGIPFGIITNGSTRQNFKIDQLALRSRTQCIFISAEFGCSKPDPAIFQAAASCLGVPCEQILFVGDNPHADICGADAVGMTTAWLHRGTSWPDTIPAVQPDFIIDSFADLLTILPPTEGQSLHE